MISIIITAYKEPNTIGKAIEQVLKNKISDRFEIIISAPDKGTLDVARTYAKKNKRIKIIQDFGKGKPTALNLVFKKAKGEFLVLTDGDVFVDDNAIQPLLDALRVHKNSRIGAVTGRPIPQESREEKYGYWAHFLFNSAHKLRAEKANRSEFLFLSGYLFAMRNFKLQIPSDVLDDAYISQVIWKKGYTIGYEPNAKVFIKNPANFSDWIKQKRRNLSGDIRIKEYLRTIQNSRSFKEELSQFYRVFSFAKSIREIGYSFELLFARLLIWWLGFYDIRIKKKALNKVWVRIESTK
jgi:cellulose synthase/poly-beta-1,6-N-acetylglucosamine synthase-like glycosyltransferase